MAQPSREYYQVTGGTPLAGEIQVAGAKNAATKILLATILSAEPSVITNVPDLVDTAVVAELIRSIGGRITQRGEQWTIDTPTITNPAVGPLSRRNRLPILALGPLLTRAKQAEVPVVGGDAIGPRPVNFHTTALRAMGAEITGRSDRYLARTSGLHGATIQLPYPSVGATENIILAAVCARGRTVIRNGAVEPEIIDVVQLLQNMGAIIELGTNRTWYIEGVPELHGAHYRVMPDRNEAVSFACLALATGGEIQVNGARQADLMTFLNTVRRIGGGFTINDRGIKFFRPGSLRAIDLETDTHPGYMTDWQQPLITVLTQATGVSHLHETVYEDRLGYTGALQAMGASLETTTDCLGQLPCRWWAQGFQHSCTVTGPAALHGAEVTMPDIRAGMAHLIAALTATGISRLWGIEHIDRGYQQLDQRLGALGARLKRSQQV